MPRPVLLLTQHPPVPVTSGAVRDTGVMRHDRPALLAREAMIAVPRGECSPDRTA